jgi:hypothetical protein
MRTNRVSYIMVCIAFATLAAGMLFMAGCAKSQPPDYYVVTGTGAADDTLRPQQRRLMALKAAKEDARRQILEAAKGVQITSTTTVRDFITQSDVVQSKVIGVIAGAQIVGEPRYMDDGSVEIDMRLDMNQVKKAVK